jgi:DNA-binding NarL/FixJ family response regulator
MEGHIEPAGEVLSYDPGPVLTEGERHILDLIWRGYTNNMIAATLKTSTRVIDMQRETLLKKFAVTNSVQLVRAGLRLGLLQM